MSAREPALSLAPDAVDLAVDFAGQPLKSPLLAASGCFAYGQQFAEFCDLGRLGGLVDQRDLTAAAPRQPSAADL
jgi:dihydroorotate dehydrogenase